MQTPGFIHELEKLLAFSESRRAVVMCLEAEWRQCHRQLIADALMARDIDVRHILSGREPAPHELTPFACVAGSAVSHPALV